MLEKFKKLLKDCIGTAIDEIELLEKNLLVISNPQAAANIERCVARLPVVEYAYYYPEKGGIVFSLKN